jgi:hypothetical protein
MYCPKCGTENHDNNYRCIKCGQVLHPDKHAIIVETEDGMGKLIPYKNPKALASYYVGLFSFLPGLGLFIGITAFILGLMGLHDARKKPEIRGKIHAWVGIILGGLFGFGYLALVLIAIYFSIFG